MHWRRKWQPTPVFLPGESQGQGSLVSCRLWGCTESDMTEVMQQQQQQLTKERLGGQRGQEFRPAVGGSQTVDGLGHQSRHWGFRKRLTANKEWPAERLGTPDSFIQKYLPNAPYGTAIDL